MRINDRYESFVDVVVHQLLDIFLTVTSGMLLPYEDDTYVDERGDLFFLSMSYWHSPRSLVYHPDTLVEVIE
jgi:hypothetical protein